MSRHEEIKNLWKDNLKEPEIEPELFVCFCHEYRCPNRDYSLCPENCEKPGPKKVCPQGYCQVYLRNPEECEKQILDLQEKGKAKIKHIQGHPTRKL